MAFQNKGVNREKVRYEIQEIGNLTGEGLNKSHDGQLCILLTEQADWLEQESSVKDVSNKK